MKTVWYNVESDCLVIAEEIKPFLFRYKDNTAIRDNSYLVQYSDNKNYINYVLVDTKVLLKECILIGDFE